MRGSGPAACDRAPAPRRPAPVRWRPDPLRGPHMTPERRIGLRRGPTRQESRSNPVEPDPARGRADGHAADLDHCQWPPRAIGGEAMGWRAATAARGWDPPRARGWDPAMATGCD